MLNRESFTHGSFSKEYDRWKRLTGSPYHKGWIYSCILRLTACIHSRVRLYTSTTLTLSLYESNRYLLADNGVAINNYTFTNQTPTSTQQPTDQHPSHQTNPSPTPNQRLIQPALKQLANTHVTKNSPKPTATSNSPRITNQHPNHQTNPSLNRKVTNHRVNNQVLLKSPITSLFQSWEWMMDSQDARRI